MINKLINNFVFINFCGQKIGHYNDKYIKSNIINVLTMQIAFLMFIPWMYICILILKFRSFLAIFIPMIIINYVIYYLLKRHLFFKINFHQMTLNYRLITRKRRILNFIFSLVIIIGSFISFCVSLLFIKFFQ